MSIYNNNIRLANFFAQVFDWNYKKLPSLQWVFVAYLHIFLDVVYRSLLFCVKSRDYHVKEGMECFNILKMGNIPIVSFSCIKINCFLILCIFYITLRYVTFAKLKFKHYEQVVLSELNSTIFLQITRT